jgi:hypothetical protein
MRPCNIPPTGVLAIVSIPQHLSCFFDLLDPNWIIHGKSRYVTLDNEVRTSKQAVFIPLQASTALPSLTTDIAELGSASATVQR